MGFYSVYKIAYAQDADSNRRFRVLDPKQSVKQLAQLVTDYPTRVSYVGLRLIEGTFSVFYKITLNGVTRDYVDCYFCDSFGTLRFLHRVFQNAIEGSDNHA